MTLVERLKRSVHIHKYTTLQMYPPRPKYYSYTWEFLVECDCGVVKLTKLPSTLTKVTEMIVDEAKT